jgi:hypothetical protein
MEQQMPAGQDGCQPKGNERQPRSPESRNESQTKTHERENDGQVRSPSPKNDGQDGLPATKMEACLEKTEAMDLEANAE